MPLLHVGQLRRIIHMRLGPLVVISQDHLVGLRLFDIDFRRHIRLAGCSWSGEHEGRCGQVRVFVDSFTRLVHEGIVEAVGPLLALFSHVRELCVGAIRPRVAVGVKVVSSHCEARHARLGIALSQVVKVQSLYIHGWW